MILVISSLLSKLVLWPYVPTGIKGKLAVFLNQVSNDHYRRKVPANLDAREIA